MESTTYTRETAAKKLLALSHRLSSEVFIFQTIGLKLKQDAIADLRGIVAGLVLIGYPLESSTLTTLSSALSILTSDDQQAFLPFSIAIRTAQLLLSAVEALSISSSPFPVPNSKIPPELLHLIYTYIIQQAPLTDTLPETEHGEQAPNPFQIRQETIFNLSLTSKHWYQIVTQRPVVYINSVLKLQKFSTMYHSWRKADEARWRRGLEEVHIELPTVAGISARDSQWLLFSLKYFKQAKGAKPRGRLIVTFDSTALMSALTTTNNSIERWQRLMVRIPKVTPNMFPDVGRLLGEVSRREGQEIDYYINYGHTLKNSYSSSKIQNLLDIRGPSGRPHPPGTALPPSPVFTDYTTFAALGFTFTVPQFLLQTVSPDRRPAILPPSRLRHLEITLKFVSTEPARAVQEIQSFFSTIAPSIERLSVLIRITARHPSPADESTFTQEFVKGLSSCRRLQQFEIGGFGLSPNFLSNLTSFRLRSLSIRPLQYVKASEDLTKLLHSPLRQTLVTLSNRYESDRPEDIEPTPSSLSGSWLPRIPEFLTTNRPRISTPSTPSTTSTLGPLAVRAKELGIKLVLVRMPQEFEVTRSLMGPAGLDAYTLR
ncbi:hypothetical protein JCM5350_004758 [Sporobolomyces pararoseus]